MAMGGARGSGKVEYDMAAGVHGRGRTKRLKGRTGSNAAVADVHVTGRAVHRTGCLVADISHQFRAAPAGV
ncbi:unnamed protein product [Litomosoides sigmodontis]|uniref:Uncharacterized protein n=1 Tax=Litomosoides sigmodontis TaxID=42156 RepID=A0A3P6SJT6_LITSI|nr:unnamed protein product [Litomosoides sigmodontis]